VVELSDGTRERLLALFSVCDAPDAQRLLEHECADNLPLLFPPVTPQSLERIRFAALKLSEGDLGKLHYAVDVANRDWRDVLVAAGFGNDVRAHEAWHPE